MSDERTTDEIIEEIVTTQIEKAKAERDLMNKWLRHFGEMNVYAGALYRSLNDLNISIVNKDRKRIDYYVKQTQISAINLEEYCNILARDAHRHEPLWNEDEADEQ